MKPAPPPNEPSLRPLSASQRVSVSAFSDCSQLLSDHFATLAETPDAVAKLRKLVLDFAIRGRLVAQNLKDEPAIKLVERAQAGLTKKREKTTEQQNGEHDILPFSLPKNWCWTCLEELGEISPRNDLADKTQVGFSPMRLVNAKFGVPIEFERKTWGEIRKGFTHFAEGDVVVAKITPCFENGKSGVIRGVPNGYGAGTTEFHVLHPVANCVLPEYVLAFLKSPHFLVNGEKHMTGSAGQKRVPSNYFAKTPFPLPPLAEQKRIVAKVEELLALCDELEAAQTAAHEHRTHLVRSALDHLTTAQTEPEFRQHAAFVLQHSDLVLDSVSDLRKAILLLAVHGHLVPHDKKQTRNVKLAEVADSRLGKMLDQQKNSGTPRPYLRNTNVHWFKFELDSIKELRLEDDELESYSLKMGDVLICEGGHGIGRTAVWNCEIPGMIFQKALHRVRPGKELDSHFFSFCMKVLADTGELEKYYTGAGIPHFTGQSLAKMTFPLPPLAEQQRIVAKVDELMRWCDALEVRLTTAQTTAEHLLDATLHQILAA